MPLTVDNSKLNKPSKTSVSLKRRASTTFQKIFKRSGSKASGNEASPTPTSNPVEESERPAESVNANSNGSVGGTSRRNKPVPKLSTLLEVETLLTAKDDEEFKTDSQVELSGSAPTTLQRSKAGHRALFKILESEKENDSSSKNSPSETAESSNLDLTEDTVRLHPTIEKTELDNSKARKDEDPKEME